MASGKLKVIEAWMGFCDGTPHLYVTDEDGRQQFDLFIKKKDAKKCYEDVRKVRLEWWQETL
jgi:hypothetical protein